MSDHSSQNPTEEQLKEARNVQVTGVIKNYWKVVNDDLPILPIEPNHRSYIKIPNIQEIKKTLKEKLGFIAVYAFINMIGSIVGWLTGPHNNVDNILVILYSFVENMLPSESRSPSESTLRRNIDMIFKEKHKPSKCKKKPDPEVIYGAEVRKWAADCLKNMFSNPIIRLTTSKLTNAKNFDFGTLFIDGHDNRVQYGQKTIFHRKDYISFKFSKTGIRTQILMDNQEFALGVSNSLSCGPNVDGTMWKNMDIHSLISFSSYDVIFFDGAYLLSMNEYIEKCEEQGKDFNWNNFRCPIRKERYQDLDKSETEYNEQFGAFRGMIETFFSHFTEKFKIFGSSTKWKLSENFEDPFNVKLQVCLVLFNIQRFCQKYHIEPELKHTAWMKEDFEFLHEESKHEPTPQLQEILQMNKDIRKEQNDFLSYLCNLSPEKQRSIPQNSTLEEIRETETYSSPENLMEQFDEIVGQSSTPNKRKNVEESSDESQSETESKSDTEHESDTESERESLSQETRPRTQQRKNQTPKQKRRIELTPPKQPSPPVKIGISPSLKKKLTDKRK